MGEARESPAVAVLDGKLYTVGGLGGYNDDDEDVDLISVERYDPALDAWEEVAAMEEARDRLAVTVLDGKLYAVAGLGGAGYNALSSVERYDPAVGAWEAVAQTGTARSASIAVLM